MTLNMVSKGMMPLGGEHSFYAEACHTRLWSRILAPKNYGRLLGGSDEEDEYSNHSSQHPVIRIFKI